MNTPIKLQIPRRSSDLAELTITLARASRASWVHIDAAARQLRRASRLAKRTAEGVCSGRAPAYSEEVPTEETERNYARAEGMIRDALDALGLRVKRVEVGGDPRGACVALWAKWAPDNSAHRDGRFVW